jgi:hypothetical protein
MGSCFAGAVGVRMERMKMPVTVNPFGVVYNPASLVDTLERLEQGAPLAEEELREDRGLWFAFSHPSAFASPDRAQALEAINRSIQQGHSALLRADYLILTLGTAWVYELVESGRIVNNCHKIPAAAFRRRRLSADEIAEAFVRLLERPLYQNKHILLTVSPIRHLKDGLVENSFSKSILRVAAQAVVDRCENAHYFPAYEIVMDDLRDYRFYERDMVHPSAVAADYIWEAFCGALVDEKALSLFPRIEKIRSAREHRPFHPQSAEHQAFRKAMLSEIKALQQACPGLDFADEYDWFNQKRV